MIKVLGFGLIFGSYVEGACLKSVMSTWMKKLAAAYSPAAFP